MARCPFAEWIPSPNFTAGWSAGKPSRVIDHTTTTTWANAIAELTSADADPVSAHFLIGLDGRIAQLVDTANMAWHARSGNSVGIGKEHVDDGDWWNIVRTPAQYAASAKVNRWITATHPSVPLGADDPHNKYVATACPDGLDVERIIIETLGGDMADYVPRDEYDKLVLWLAGTFDAVKARLAIDAHHRGHSAEHQGEPIEPKQLARGIPAGDVRIDTSWLDRRVRDIDARERKRRLAKRPTRAEVRAGHGKG